MSDKNEGLVVCDKHRICSVQDCGAKKPCEVKAENPMPPEYCFRGFGKCDWDYKGVVSNGKTTEQ